jgi:hypothetical protein
MRVNLITRAFGHSQSGTDAIPISLTVRPACGLPGEYEYRTDSAALLLMLREQTELPATVLQRFEEKLRAFHSARLLGVDLSDIALERIGYFID